MKKLLCILTLFFTFAAVADGPSQEKIQEFSRNYKGANSERKRLELCIDAIDQGLIHRGVTVGNIDQLFGTDFSKKTQNAGKSWTPGVVDFKGPIPPPSDLIQAGRSGWYFAFEFDNHGFIQNYYLSNLHK
jgi:hypothetical protein